jgi:hypothetical protein
MQDEQYTDETVWELCSPIPNPWFSSEIIYEGLGIAEFEKPKGIIEGNTTISVNEAGDLKVEMEYEKLITEETIYGTENFKYMKFLYQSNSNDNTVAIGIENRNPCSGLIVKTKDGTFNSDGKIFWNAGFGLDDKIIFYLFNGSYKTASKSHPKYWVMPLINFISSFPRTNNAELLQHPLRLLRIPEVPEFSDEHQKEIAYLAILNSMNLIEFFFGEYLGFIQPVLEYEERAKKIKSGEIKRHITALMVSEILAKIDVRTFSTDFSDLLSFAVGTEVIAPWIEIRDEKGMLLERKHIYHHDTHYRKGYAAIEEPLHNGIGQLLTCASNSEEFGKSYFRVLIAHLIRLQPYGRQIEDHLDLICRTFDTLCEEFGLSTQNLYAYLPQECRTEIDSILRNAKKSIRDLAARSSINIQPVLQQIGSRIENAKNTDRAFGLSVIDLLRTHLKNALSRIRMQANWTKPRKFSILCS